VTESKEQGFGDMKTISLAPMPILLAAALLAGCASDDEAIRTSTGTGGGVPPAQQTSRAADSSVLAAPPGGRAVETGAAEEFRLNVGDRVLFGLDRYDLNQAAQSILDRQAAWLSRNPSRQLVIEGYADERGTREYNLALGERRAEAVKNYLASKGIPADRIRVISYGKERPVVAGHDESAWSQNRRAVTVLN